MGELEKMTVPQLKKRLKALRLVRFSRKNANIEAGAIEGILNAKGWRIKTGPKGGYSFIRSA